MAQRLPDAADVLDSEVDIMGVSSLQILQHRPHFNNTDLPTGFLFSPLSMPLGTIPHSPEAPPQCSACGAFANMYSTFQHSVSSWVCNFCGSTSVYAPGFPIDAPCLHAPDFDVLPADASSALLEAHSWPDVVLLLIDATLDEDLLEEVTEACKDLVHRLPPKTLISLITFDSAVTLYDLSCPSGGPTNSWVLPGDTHATPAMLQRLTATCEGFIVPVSTCMHALCAALDALRPLHTLNVPRARPRCTGAALEGARLLYGAYMDARIIEVPPEPMVRVMTMLGGPCTCGPGSASMEVVDGEAAAADGMDQFLMLEAEKFVATLAAGLHDAGMVVDIISGGLNASNLALWDRAVTHTGGTLTIQEGFGGLLSANLAAMLQRAQAAAVSLDFSASDGLAVENVIGPSVTTAVPTRIPPTFQHRTPSRRRLQSPGSIGSGGGAEFARSTLAACDTDSLEAGQAFAVLLKSTQDLEGGYAVVQAVARWRNPAGLAVMRVATRRLEVTRNFAAYATSLCHPASSVLLAKSLILAAENQGASRDPQALEDARARCASLLRSLARTAGVPTERRRGWGSFLLGAGLFGAGESWQLPRCLLPVAEALYHLQRGQLLGHVVGHSDERAQLFHLFLKADLSLAQAALVPSAYQVTPDGQGVMPMRPCDLILDANTVIVLDCGTQIFLWLGSNLPLPPDAAAAVCRESLLALNAAAAGDAATVTDSENPGSLVTQSVHVAHACAVGRVPVPELRACLEGTGDERYVLSRLAPTTTDQEEDIRAQLPHLAAAHAENAAYAEQMVAHIVRRLPRSDDASLVAWAAQAGVDVRPALHGAEIGGDLVPPGGRGAAAEGGIAQARLEAERLSSSAAAASQAKFRLVAPKAERNPFRGGRRRSPSGQVTGDPAEGETVDGEAGPHVGPPSVVGNDRALPGRPQMPSSGGSSNSCGPPVPLDVRGAQGGAVPDQFRPPPGTDHGPVGSAGGLARGGEFAPHPASEVRTGAGGTGAAVAAANAGVPGMPPFRPPVPGMMPGMPGRPSSAGPLSGPPPLLNARARPVSAGVGGAGHGVERPPTVPGLQWPLKGQPPGMTAVGGGEGQHGGPPAPPGMQAMQRTHS
eukprot:jgi/Ulvmu1/5999/UM026_0123.1